MEEKKMDLRIIKTQRSIHSAFLELMKEKGFSKLTVKDIISTAEINRSTFYAHYEDKYDLLEQVERELLNRINEAPIREGVLQGDIDNEAFVEVVRSRAQLIKENGQLLAMLLSEDGDPAFAGRLGDSIYRLWKSANVSGKFILPDQYAMAMLIGMLTGVLSEWIRSGFRESPEEFSSMVVTVFQAFQKAMLAR